MPDDKEEGPRQDTPKQILCPTCGNFAQRIIYRLLDCKTGKTIRLYQCQCGEYVCDD